MTLETIPFDAAKYLKSPDSQAELISDARNTEDKIDLWLISGAERFRRDPVLCQALLSVANHHDSRRCLLLMEAIIETPALLDRLFDVLRPQTGEKPGKSAEKPEKRIPSLRNDKQQSTTRPQKGAARRNRT